MTVSCILVGRYESCMKFSSHYEKAKQSTPAGYAGRGAGNENLSYSDAATALTPPTYTGAGQFRSHLSR